MFEQVVWDYVGVSLLAILPGLLSLGIFLWIIFGIKSSPESRILAVFVLANSVWQLNEGLMRLTDDPVIAYRFYRVSVMGILATTAFGLHFIMYFTQKEHIANAKWFKIVNYSGSIFFVITIYLTNDIIRIQRSEDWNWVSFPNYNTIELLLVLLIIIQGILMLICTAVYAIRTTMSGSNIQKRAWLLFVGLAIPISVGIVNQALIPYISHSREIPVTTFTVCFFSIAATISLAKFNLLKYNPLQASSQIFKYISEGITVTDADDVIQYVNPQFASIVSYSVDELIGMEHSRLIEKPPDKTAPHVIVENEGLSQQKEIQLIRKDGSIVDSIICTSPFYDSNGKISGEMGIHLDITERKRTLQKLEDEQRQSKQFQSMLLSSQINPHFIFNSLNAVQYHILDKDVEPALNYISEFSMLIRSVLENSMHQFITLKEEIDFIDLYLKLEKQRFRERFNYEIVVEPGINPKELLIPPMLLQPYVENAIVHGIAGIEGKGKVSVSFVKVGNSIRCTIEDNGIGREKAMERKKLRTGVDSVSNMKNPETRLKLLNELENNSYKVEIDDMKCKRGKPMGTRAMITFPIKRD